MALALLGCAPEAPHRPAPAVSETPGPDTAAHPVSSAPAPEGALRLATAQGSARVGWVDLAIDVDGTAHAVWGSREGADATLWYARVGEGEALSPPLALVPGDLPVVLGTAFEPSIDVAAGRVAVAVGARDKTETRIHLYEGAANAASFGPPAVIAGAAGAAAVSQPEAVVAPNGEVVATWKEEVDDHVFVQWWGSASEAYAPRPIPAPGAPCECCPSQLASASGGELFLAFRNNEWNLREIYFARLLAGARDFDAAVQASETGWRIPACPLEGPRFVETDEHLVLTWVDGTAGDEWLSWIATSTDGGLTWGPGWLLDPGSPWSQSRPRVAWDGATGRLWHVVDEIGRGALVRWTSDLGVTWTLPSLPEVGAPLERAVIASQGGRTALLGVADEREVWLVEL